MLVRERMYLLVRSCFLSAERRATPPCATPPCSSNTPSKIFLVIASKAAEDKSENGTRTPQRGHIVASGKQQFRTVMKSSVSVPSALTRFRARHILSLIRQSD